MAVFAGVVVGGAIAVALVLPLSADAPPPRTETPAWRQTDATPVINPPTSPLLRGVYDLISEFSDSQLEGKESLLSEIRAADELLVRVKRQNREGLWRVNHPPQRSTR